MIDAIRAAPRRATSYGLDAIRTGLLLRYLAVGALKVVVDFAVFNAAIASLGSSSTGSLLLANSCGFLGAAWVAYRLSSGFVFRVRRRRGDFPRFLAVSLAGGVLYNVALLALVMGTNAEGSVELNVVKLAALGTSAGGNFLGYALFVFRPRTGALREADAERQRRAA